MTTAELIAWVGADQAVRLRGGGPPTLSVVGPDPARAVPRHPGDDPSAASSGTRERR